MAFVDFANGLGRVEDFQVPDAGQAEGVDLLYLFLVSQVLQA